MTKHMLSPQRDKDFIEVCRRHPKWLTDRAAAAKETAATARAPRYYIDIDYAYRRVLSIIKHGNIPTSPMSRQLWSELLTEVAAKVALKPGCHIIDAVTEVIAEGKPSGFFISPSKAVKIACRHRKAGHRD